MQNREVYKKWYEANAVRLKKTRKAYYEKQKAADRFWWRKYYKYDPNKNLQKKYGLSLVERQALIKASKYMCPICKIPYCETDSLKLWPIDHDHETGKIRNVLCVSCNSGLGMFKDSIDNLKNAIKYLNKHDKNK
jgi:hypothetical protein